MTLLGTSAETKYITPALKFNWTTNQSVIEEIAPANYSKLNGQTKVKIYGEYLISYFHPYGFNTSKF